MKIKEASPSEWPIGETEELESCPLCKSSDFWIIYEHLTDEVFQVAPGEWTLRGCVKCGSAFLNPRPTRETIGMAYSKYYTHNSDGGKEPFQALSLARKLRRILRNGYANWRYGSMDMPSSRAGIPVAFAFPFIRKVVDHEYRYLPEITDSDKRVLDIGCGNGSFLLLAKRCGWTVYGVETDCQSRQLCISQGIENMHSHVQELKQFNSSFDYISINHVIEHLHDPLEMLEFAYDLLKPGGKIWVETPNIESDGHKLFRAAWMALDPPRHLIIFTKDSLKFALEESGFERVVWMGLPSEAKETFKISSEIRSSKHSADSLPSVRWPLWMSARLSAIRSTLSNRRSESIALVACKPDKLT